MNLSKNFTSDELKCSHCGKCEMEKEFVVLLQALRDAWGKPLTILSGYRCIEHNTKVGGAKNSQHVLGKAVDISIVNMDGLQKFKLLDLIYKTGFTGIGLHKQFFHVDNRQAIPCVWFY
jgi:uncharacterized protein YcbK (DUF882 family)